MKAIVFDFETTGLTKHPDSKDEVQPRIIEIGAALVQQGLVLDTMSQLVHPGEAITEEISGITGITNDDLKHCGVFGSYLPQLWTMFKAADLMVAHNLPFDKRCLELELAREGIEDFPWPASAMCTVAEFKEEYGGRVKLEKLYEDVIGEKYEQTHRALDDVMMLVKIINKEGLI